MKKSLVLLLALWGMMAVGADLCRLAQSGHFRNFSTYGNAAAKVLEKEGKNALEVTLGGINDQVSGAVFFKRPKELTIAPELNTLSITYKGDGSVGNFVVVVQDIDNNSFCWNGKRWQAQTQLPCYDEDWVKRVLKVSEFVYAGKAEGEAPQLRFEKIVSVHLAVGMQMKKPGDRRARFYLYEIALEKDGQPQRVFRAPAKVQEAPALLAPPKEVRYEGTPKLPEAKNYHLPQWVNWEVSSHYQRSTRTRHSISLNNYWQFQVMPESTVAKVLAAKGKQPAMRTQVPTDGKWLYTKVPGRWDGRNFYLYDRDRNKYTAIDGLITSDYTQGFFRRAVEVPAQWQGSSFLLQFNAVTDQARLFVNGVQVQDFSRTGQVDVTPLIVPGRLNEVALEVEYTSMPLDVSHFKHKEFLESDKGSSWWFGWHDGPGITDDVWLHIIPKELPGSDLRIITSVAEKKITAGAQFSNFGKSEIPVMVSAQVLDGEKQVLSIPPQKQLLPPQRTTRLEVAAPWADFICWSPNNPKLYTLRYQVRDMSGKVLDELSSEFGFRELTFQGGDFYLNGAKIRLNFKSSQFRYAELTEFGLHQMLCELKKMHFNGLILETMNERVVKMCNRLGMMVVLRHVMPPLVRNGTYLPGVTNVGYPFETYLAPRLAEAKAELEATILGIVQKFRNDPSLVIWAINPLLCWNGEWINPNLLDAKQPENDILTASLREEEYLRRIDPSRLVLQSMGGSAGSIIAANPYPTFENNPDEWADWPMRWAERKEKPLLLEEIALLFNACYASWYNDRLNKYAPWNDNFQLYYEQAARYFGDAIYTHATPDQDDAGWYNSRQRMLNTDGISHCQMDFAAEATADLWLKRCLLNWRAYGISGIWLFEATRAYFGYAEAPKQEVPSAKDITAPGAKPDEVGEFSYRFPNRIHAATIYGQQPFLAFIAGRPERFSSREHGYYVGQRVDKQIFVSNDAQTPANTGIQWQIRRVKDNTVVASGKKECVVQPCEVHREAIQWVAPAVATKEDYRLEMTATNGKDVCRDAFEFRVYPREKAAFNGMVLLYDESGKSREMLKKMGVSYTEEITAANLDKAAALIVGQQSFSKEFLKRFAQLDLEGRLNAGLTMVVMAQDTDSIMKNYLEERRVRFAFVKDRRHPVLAGLEEQEFRYWRGEPDMLEPYPNTGMSSRNNRFMRWGTEGVVASFVMDKPTQGRFRVLLDADADLSRTVLMEYLVGRGRIIFSQLDISPRYGVDPVATKVAEQLLRHAMSPVSAPQVVSAVFSGKEMLPKELGFQFLPEASLKQAQVLVLTHGYTLSPNAIRDFAQQGGQVLAMGLDAAEIAKLGCTVPVSKKVRLAQFPADSTLLRGLGNSDFYFNPAVTLPVFGDASVINTTPVGKGSITLFTVTPKMVKEPATVNKIRRIASVMLTNLGVDALSPVALTPQAGDIEIDGTMVPFQIDPAAVGEKQGWQNPALDDRSWQRIEVGPHWEGQGITMANPHFKAAAALPYDGDAWYRITVEIPPQWQGRQLYFEATAIDDLDKCWFNGVKIGETTLETPRYWEVKRLYPIPASAVRYGEKNVLAVRVRDLRGNGGIIGKARIGGKERATTAIFYPHATRLIRDFDPNRWRQW